MTDTTICGVLKHGGRAQQLDRQQLQVSLLRRELSLSIGEPCGQNAQFYETDGLSSTMSPMLVFS